MKPTTRDAVRGSLEALGLLGLLVFALMAFTTALWAESTPDWPGQPAVEAEVRTQIAGLWRVAPDELEIEFGTVHSDWVPGDDLEVELKGTGRGGHFIAAASDSMGNVSVRIRAGRSVLRTVAAHALTRGSFLTEDDLALARMIEWGLEYDAQPTDVIGWEVKRAISEGEVLFEPTIAPPAAVVSGRSIQVEFRSGAVAITMSGTALGTAPIGDDVFVRTQTGERLRGRVTAPGRVLVDSNRYAP